MYYIKETTQWDAPNHIYIFNDKKSAKCIGYIPTGKKDIFLFDKPLSFDKRKRSFVEVKPEDLIVS